MALKPNYYETLYVVRPDLNEEELGKIQSKLPEFINLHEGEIVRSDKWADRELAYEIQDHKRGTYYILVFKALPTVMKEIEKHLRFYNTDVLRFMTVKINEEHALREKNAGESKKEQTAPAETPPQTQSTQPAKETSAPEPVKTEEPAAQTPVQEPASAENNESETQASDQSKGGNE